MDLKNLEKIFDHLDRCRQEGKPLQLNINEDLPKILPLPRRLILDFFSLPFNSTIFRISDDQQTISFQNSVSQSMNLMFIREFLSLFYVEMTHVD